MKTITIDGEPYELHTYCPLRDTEDLCAILKKVEKPVVPLVEWQQTSCRTWEGMFGASNSTANWLVDELEDSLKRDVFATEQIRDGAECALRKLKRLIGRKD